MDLEGEWAVSLGVPVGHEGESQCAENECEQGSVIGVGSATVEGPRAST